MNRKAIIKGREYMLLEIIPSLDGGQSLLLCKDENGKRAACSESLWGSCALTDMRSAPIHAHSSSQEKIEYFLSVFKGRTKKLRDSVLKWTPGLSPLKKKRV